jgi:hypothetical protein
VAEAFSPDSRIRDVVAAAGGRRLLFEHGYDIGEGFTDVLSQYQTLEDAVRAGRLRDLAGLLAELASTPSAQA